MSSHQKHDSRIKHPNTLGADDKVSLEIFEASASVLYSGRQTARPDLVCVLLVNGCCRSRRFECFPSARQLNDGFSLCDNDPSRHSTSEYSQVLCVCQSRGILMSTLTQLPAHEDEAARPQGNFKWNGSRARSPSMNARSDTPTG